MGNKRIEHNERSSSFERMNRRSIDVDEFKRKLGFVAYKCNEYAFTFVNGRLRERYKRFSLHFKGYLVIFSALYKHFHQVSHNHRISLN